MTNEPKVTEIEFGCNLTLEEKYNLLMTGNYGAFEIFSADGEITAYRGFAKYKGTTGVYSTYREACEAAIYEFGNK